MEAASATGLPIVIAGDGPEGADLRQLSQSRGARNVIFTGSVTDAEKHALMRNCRALVLPSHLRSEAFGMVLVEAAMLGKPMISCEIGTGTSFVNLDGVTGLVAKPNDAGDLGRALREIETSAARAAQLGMAARQRYESLFSGESLGRSYANLFTAVAQRARGRVPQ
jgi:rhamnosyl/mannosyltransferase